jgi:hypothetical protein
MDQVHTQLLYAQQLSTYALLFIALLTFLGVCATSWALYVTRGMGRAMEETRRYVAESQRETAQILAEIRAGNERMSHYLFVKLGPAELK